MMEIFIQLKFSVEESLPIVFDILLPSTIENSEKRVY